MRLMTTRRKRDKFTKGRTLDDCETYLSQIGLGFQWKHLKRTKNMTYSLIPSRYPNIYVEWHFQNWVMEKWKENGSNVDAKIWNNLWPETSQTKNGMPSKRHPTNNQALVGLILMFPKIMVPQNGWFISWKNLCFNGWFGVPLFFWKHPYCK